MTLNASGPISLGGSTVGQSVNLELGNSATALASINSTQFRTLAGVPSGAIALSNFYGKSNAVAWVYYLGQYKDAPNTGASASLGQQILQGSWSAGRNSGTIAVHVAATASAPFQFGVRWIDSTGTVIGTKNINLSQPSASYNPYSLRPTYSNSTDYYGVLGPGQAYTNFLAANGSSYTFGTGPSWKASNGLQQDWYYGNGGSCADSSGNLAFSGYVPTKVTNYLVVQKFTNSGVSIGSLQMTNGNQGQYSAALSVYPRSDGSLVSFGHVGSTSASSGGAYIFASDMSTCTAAYDLANNGGGAGNGWYNTAFDSINNIAYMGGPVSAAGNAFGIARFSSTFTNTAFVSYYDSTDGYNFQSSGRGMSYYGGYVYFGGGVNTSAGADWTYLVKVDGTTLAVVWAYKFKITGGAVVGLAPKYPYINLFATAKGVAFTYLCNTGDSYLYMLGATPNVGTYTIPSANGGGTFTLTISAISVTTGTHGAWATSNRSTSVNGVSVYTANYGSAAISSFTPNQPVGLTNL